MVGHIAVLGAKGLPAKGGGERVAEAIILSALQKGFKVTVYGKKDYCGTVDYGPNFRLIRIRDLKGKHLSAFSFGILSAFHALLFGDYDVVHLHYADLGFMVPLLRLRFKVVATSHGAEYNRDKWGGFAKFCLRVSEAPFVLCSNICTSVSRQLAGQYTQKYHSPVHFIPNGTDTVPVRLNEANGNGRTCSESGDYVLFAAGRIIPSKGCDLLLQANSRSKFDTKIVIIGKIENDSYRTYLESMPAENIEFIDFIASKEELLKVVANARFFVFPSTYEAMSMMLLEVASLRKGIVCSDIPENRDAIGLNAVYFKSGDSDDLSEKIRFALDNPDVMDELGRKAHGFVKTSRNWEVITPVYHDIYRALINTK